MKKLLRTQIRDGVSNSACGFIAAAPDRAALNQEAGDFPSIETLFRRRGKMRLSWPRRAKPTYLPRHGGIRTAR